MPEEAHSISLENLPDAIRIMNESSRGMSFEWHLDFFGFLAVARYWNISFDHTLIGYIDSEPASLIINCTDPEARCAYTVYWGTLPRFRSRRISLKLFDMSCEKLYRDGYIELYGVSVPDRPVRRYRFIQALPDCVLMDMEAETPKLPAVNPNFVVREVDVGTVTQLALPSGQTFHWCQRHNFLRGSASFLQFLGAFSGDEMKAYAVATPRSANTSIVDLRSTENSPAPGYELLRYLLSQNYRPPFAANFVFEQSYAHRVLASAGFVVKKQFAALYRDLRTTCRAKNSASQ